MGQLFKKEVKRHLVDSTAIATFVNPIYASLETIMAGMTDDVSLRSRLYNTAITYGFLGSVTKIRDSSKKFFKITQESKEHQKALHDILFAGIFVVGIKPMTYFIAGETDWKKIAVATGLSVVAGGALAYPLGYFLDSYREVFNIEKTNRLPKYIKNKSDKIQKTLVGLMGAASVGGVALVYTFNDYIQKII